MGNEASTAASAGKKNRRISNFMQRKLAGGVDLNLKVLVRGERGTGKTALIRRLQGETRLKQGDAENPYVPDYEPTGEIQVTTINWSYKNQEQTVKVEVWDVVDEGRPGALDTSTVSSHATSASSGEKFDPKNTPSGAHVVGVLDASTVDVYKHAHACVFMVDLRRRSTFDYVCKELETMPQNIDVLILGNFRDLCEARGMPTSKLAPGSSEPASRAVSREDLAALVERGRARKSESGKGKECGLHFVDCSLRNGFGLRAMHCYLNLPFLRLKREALENKLREAVKEIELAKTEVAMYVEQPEDGGARYEAFAAAHEEREAEIERKQKIADKARMISSSSSASRTASSGGGANTFSGGSPLGEKVNVLSGGPSSSSSSSSLSSSSGAISATPEGRRSSVSMFTSMFSAAKSAFTSSTEKPKPASAGSSSETRTKDPVSPMHGQSTGDATFMNTPSAPVSVAVAGRADTSLETFKFAGGAGLDDFLNDGDDDESDDGRETSTSAPTSFPVTTDIAVARPGSVEKDAGQLVADSRPLIVDAGGLDDFLDDDDDESDEDGQLDVAQSTEAEGSTQSTKIEADVVCEDTGTTSDDGQMSAQGTLNAALAKHSLAVAQAAVAASQANAAENELSPSSFSPSSSPSSISTNASSSGISAAALAAIANAQAQLAKQEQERKVRKDAKASKKEGKKKKKKKKKKSKE